MIGTDRTVKIRNTPSRSSAGDHGRWGVPAARGGGRASGNRQVGHLHQGVEQDEGGACQQGDRLHPAWHSDELLHPRLQGQVAPRRDHHHDHESDDQEIDQQLDAVVGGGGQTRDEEVDRDVLAAPVEHEEPEVDGPYEEQHRRRPDLHEARVEHRTHRHVDHVADQHDREAAVGEHQEGAVGDREKAVERPNQGHDSQHPRFSPCRVARDAAASAGRRSRRGERSGNPERPPARRMCVRVRREVAGLHRDACSFVRRCHCFRRQIPARAGICRPERSGDYDAPARPGYRVASTAARKPSGSAPSASIIW